jgi:phosphoribosylformylglycinamidine synthase
MIVFVGGFSNSDVLGSAKGWAGAFKYNEKARVALEKFYARKDTLSLGVCNGCQLMVELDLVVPGHEQKTPDGATMPRASSSRPSWAWTGGPQESIEHDAGQSLEGMRLGASGWPMERAVSSFPWTGEAKYHIAATYSHSQPTLPTPTARTTTWLPSARPTGGTWP